MVVHSVPTISLTANIMSPITEILRPNGAGALTQLYKFGAATNWECVKDIICDNQTTVVYNNTDTPPMILDDLYNISNPTTPTSNIITSITVAIRNLVYLIRPTGYICKILISDDNGVNIYKSGNLHLKEYVGSDPPIYGYASNNWIINQRTGNPWTWTEITNLQVGVELSSPFVDVSQVYVIVHSMELSLHVCILPKPEWNGIKVDHDIDTTGLNFWSGNRDVFTEGRNSKRMVLTGIIWNGCTNGIDTCEDIIACIRALGKLQQPITISGLRYTDLNTIFNIISFSWKENLENFNNYDWELVLEFCD